MLGVNLRILSVIIEWRRSMGSYLVSWPAWLVVEQGVSAKVGGWDPVMRLEGKGNG